ncbi:MAG: DUF3787 domain-containing protein [Clostridiales bacterium]|nr:DUF3787 domain-containing protein [Clostridiales bacterium]
MPKKRHKINGSLVPIENHYTAAWSNTEGIKSESKVSIPAEVQVKNAKEYVDTNQK